MYLGLCPDGGLGGAPSFEDARKLKRNNYNTYKKASLWSYMEDQNWLAYPVLPNHHQAARDYKRLMADNNSSNVKKMRKFYTTMLRYLHLLYFYIVMMTSSYFNQRKTENLLTLLNLLEQIRISLIILYTKNTLFSPDGDSLCIIYIFCCFEF